MPWFREFPLLFFTNGRAAVIVFFVLSGFVLALPYADGRAPGYSAFVLRRICRIYLPFAAAILCSAAIFLLTPKSAGTADWAQTYWSGESLTAAAFSGHLLMTGIWAHIFLNAPIWSLVHEMRVSLVFPWLVRLCKNTLTGIALCVLCALLSSAAVRAYGGFRDFPIITDDFVATLLATFYTLPAFMIGIIMAFNRQKITAYLDRHPSPVRAALWIAVIGLFCVFDSFRFGEVLMLGAGLLIMLVISSKRAEAFLSLAPMRWLGRVSYSLYLIHAPVLFSLILLLAGPYGYGFAAALGGVASLAAAELLCRFVEIPSMKLGKRLTRPN